MNEAPVAPKSTVPTAGTEMSTPRSRNLYWVAINGASAAMAPYPLPVTVMCTPTPELLIGQETLQQAMTLQSILLTAPMMAVRKEIKALRRSPEAVCIESPNPQPPTRGATIWSAA
jgi:hypothetical protein